MALMRFTRGAENKVEIEPAGKGEPMVSLDSENLYIGIDDYGNKAKLTVGAKVYVTSVLPRESYGDVDVTYTEGTVPSDYIVDSCVINSPNIRIAFMVFGHGDEYTPTVYADGVVCTNLVEDANHKRLFYGYMDVSIDSTQTFIIRTKKEKTNLYITRSQSGPSITSVDILDYDANIVTSVMPTHVKHGDNVNLRVVCPSDAHHIQVLDVGAAKYKSESYDYVSIGDTHVFEFDVVICDDVINAAPFTIVAMNKYNSPGDEFVTSSVLISQTTPLVSDPQIVYPDNQAAFKDEESGIIAVDMYNFDLCTITSDYFIIGKGSFTSSEQIQTAITRRDDLNDESANYMYGESNIVVTGYRNQNDSVVVKNVKVNIANAAPIITICAETEDINVISTDGSTIPKFRSGGAHGTDVQEYVILVKSDEALQSVNVDSVLGTFKEDSFESVDDTRMIWKRTLQVSDVDLQGVYSWRNPSFINDALITTTDVSDGSSYEIGGFVERQITFPTDSRMVDLRTFVSDPTKIKAIIQVAESYSPYYPGMRNANYLDQSGSLIGSPCEFTVCNESGTFDEHGNYFRWNDIYVVSMNTEFGSVVLTIEETI